MSLELYFILGIFLGMLLVDLQTQRIERQHRKRVNDCLIKFYEQGRHDEDTDMREQELER